MAQKARKISQTTTGHSAQRVKVNQAVKAAIIRDTKFVKAPTKSRRTK